MYKTTMRLDHHILPIYFLGATALIEKQSKLILQLPLYDKDLLIANKLQKHD